MLGHIIERAKKQTSQLILNVNGDQNRVLTYDLPHELTMIKDDFPDSGPLGGILAGMRFGQAQGFDHMVTFACDTPFFPEDYVARLLGCHEAPVVLSQSHGKAHPVMGLFAASLADDLQIYLEQGGRRVMDWINRHDPKLVVWDNIDPDPFFNINHPEDLERAQKYLKPRP